MDRYRHILIAVHGSGRFRNSVCACLLLEISDPETAHQIATQNAHWEVNPWYIQPHYSCRSQTKQDMMRALFILLVAAPLLSGCIARTAVNVVTAPVRVASGVADLATTSQSEADEKRGRELRKREKRLDELEKQYSAERKSCASGNASACDQMEATYAEIQALHSADPVAP